MQEPSQIIDVDIEGAEWLGAGEDGGISTLKPEQPLQVIPPDREALMWGLAGVAIGSFVTGLLTAMAFKSFARTQSPWGPALVSGVGSAVIGGSLIWVASRARDPRMVHAAGGFRLAY